MSLRSNDCFVIGATLIGGHYMTYIISSLGHTRSGLVRLLVLWMVAYSGQSTNIILQVTRDNVYLAENG
jgi:hypothetical protein